MAEILGLLSSSCPPTVNPKLKDIEKFNYLRSQLDGEAARTISGFILSNDNYKESISLLESRFGKKQRVINAHMTALLNLPVPSNSAASLRLLHDTVQCYIRGLESLGKKRDTFGDLLVSLISGKLPQPVITWTHDTDEWNNDKLHPGIEKEITILESGLENHAVNPLSLDLSLQDSERDSQDCHGGTRESVQNLYVCIVRVPIVPYTAML